MNLLRFVGKLLTNAFLFAIVGVFLGAFYGIVEGTFFGATCIFTMSLAAGGIGESISLMPVGAAWGAYFGALQGVVCGVLVGAIVGARHWAGSDDFKPLFRAFQVGARAALLGGSLGAFNGVVVSVAAAVTDAFSGFLVGSVIGWCSCFLIGALWAGLTKQRPRAAAPPLEAVLRWLWGEKRRGRAKP